MNNLAYRKTMEKFKNRINGKLLSNKKDYLKWTSKPSYMSHKIYENGLDAIHKSQFVSMVKKHAYIGIFILVFNKVLMYEFRY